MSPSGPPRVAVTRSERSDGPLSSALRHHGLTPVACPVIAHLAATDPAPLRRVADHLDQFDWVVATSARAVEALARLRPARPWPHGLRCAAVGAATAAVFERHGMAPTVVATTGGAEDLIALLRHADRWPGRTVLMPQAAEGRSEVAAALGALGAAVTVVHAYQTVCRPSAEIRQAWGEASAEGVVFASPSAARALVGAVGAADVARVRAIVGLGTTTAQTLRTLGLDPQVSPAARFDAAAGLCGALLISSDSATAR